MSAEANFIDAIRRVAMTDYSRWADPLDAMTGDINFALDALDEAKR